VGVKKGERTTKKEERRKKDRRKKDRR